jgi:hypothetical protein
VLSLAFTLVATGLLSPLAAHAAPLQQEGNIFQTPLVADVQEEMRGAFILVSQAAQATQSALQMVDTGNATGTLFAGDFSVFDNDDILAAFRILQPSTIVTLRVTWEILGIIAEGLDDFELLLEADIAEELILSQEVLNAIQITDRSGIIETEEAFDTDVPRIVGILDALDIDIEIANGECGDLDTLVRVARNDIARALGIGSMLGIGGEFGLEAELDPDVRLLALTSLAAHNLLLQNAVLCLASFQ